MFSPSGKLSHFAGRNSRIEDVIARFANLPEHERAKSQSAKKFDTLIESGAPRKIENTETLIKAAKKLNQESHIAGQLTSSRVSKLETLQYEIQRVQVQLQEAENRLRVYEGNLKCVNSIQQVEELEHHLQNALGRVQMHKQAMESSQLASLNSARAHLYAMQAQPGSLVQHDPQHIIRWLTLRDSQKNVHNISEHPGSILSLRDSQGSAECSASSSLYPRTSLSQAAELQLTSPSDQADAQALSNLRLGQFYQFEQQYMQMKDKQINVDSRNQSYLSPKVEDDHISPELTGNFGSGNVPTVSGWQSAYQMVRPTSIAPASTIQVPLSQQTMVGNMLGCQLAPSENEGMIPFEGNIAESHVEPSLPCVHGEAALESRSHNVLSLASNFDSCSYNN